MDYVFINKNLNVKPFTRFVNEDVEESERKRNLIRQATEDMIKPYGQDSETSKRVRKVAKQRGYITNQYSVAYPCYRDPYNANSYIFYDAATSRIMEVFKPKDKTEWRIRFGDKTAEEKVTDDSKRSLAATLKNNFTDLYDMWEDRAVEDMRIKSLHVSSQNVHPTILKMLASAIEQMREWVDLTDLRKTAMRIEDMTGAVRTVAAGYTNVKNEPIDVLKHERALGGKGYIEWYEKHIGKLAETPKATKDKPTKKTVAFGNATIAEIIKGMGLVSDKYVTKYDNDELLKLFNAIIQENPYAAVETKKKWREILKSLYQKYHIISTEGIDLANEEYYGPELYNPDVKNAVNNPEIRMGLRKELLSMLANFFLKAQGLGSPDSMRYKKGADFDDERLKHLPRTGIPRGGFPESLVIPAFAEFIFEGKGKVTYVVRFSKDVSENELSKVEGVAEVAKAAGANTWEITSDYDANVSDALYDFAFEHGIDILSVHEKGEEGKTAVGDTYREKYRDTLFKKLHGTYGSKRVGEFATKLEKWMQDASKVLRGGVYVRSRDGRTFDKVIFDASEKLGGFVIVTLDKSRAQYRQRIVPTESHIGDFVLPHYKNKLLLKTDAGYLAYGVPKDERTQRYYSEPRITSRNVEIYDTKEEAEKAAAEVTGNKPVVVNYDAELRNQLREEYFKVKETYDANANNSFYINPEDAKKAKADGNVKAKSTEGMSENMRNSFLEAVNTALHVETAKAAGVEAEKRQTIKTAKKKAYAGEYADVEEIDPKLAEEIQAYGKDPDKVNNSTPEEYLVKAAEIINKMSEIGIEDSIVATFVEKWVNYAEMALELAGKSLESKSAGNRVSEEQIDQVKKDLKGDTIVADDKIQYMLTMAFLQMLIRELGAVHIEHALTGWKREKTEGGTFAKSVSKYIDSEYVAKTSLPELWDRYMRAIDEEQRETSTQRQPTEAEHEFRKRHEMEPYGQGQKVTQDAVPQEKFTDLRSKLIDIAVDAIRDLEVSEEDEEKYEDQIADVESTDPEYPMSEEDRRVVMDSLSLVNSKIAAAYKTQMRNVIYELYKQEA